MWWELQRRRQENIWGDLSRGLEYLPVARGSGEILWASHPSVDIDTMNNYFRINKFCNILFILQITMFKIAFYLLQHSV